MFDIFDDMDDFALDFDMASESYYDSIEDEYNEWEDAANEAVGYAAIKDKVDAALEDFVENTKFAGKVVWESLKKAARAIIAFFKALPGRIGKLIRQTIEKIKVKFREGFKKREKADDKAARLAGEMTKEANACKSASNRLCKTIHFLSKQASTKVTNDDAERYVHMFGVYDNADKTFNTAFSSVLKKAISFTRALGNGKTDLAAHANTVIEALKIVTGALITNISVLDRCASEVEKDTKNIKEDEGHSAKYRAKSKVLSAYRSTISSFAKAKDRIDEQITYIENNKKVNEKRVEKLNKGKSTPAAQENPQAAAGGGEA